MGFKTYTCPIAKSCGGCEWLAVPYPIQLRRKQAQIAELMADFLPEGATEDDLDDLIPIHGMDAEGIIYEGKPAEMIVEVADAIGADMIVMGTNARERFLDRFFFGSVANEVVRTAGCLVLTSRPERKA